MAKTKTNTWMYIGIAVLVITVIGLIVGLTYKNLTRPRYTQPGTITISSITAGPKPGQATINFSESPGCNSCTAVFNIDAGWSSGSNVVEASTASNAGSVVFTYDPTGGSSGSVYFTVSAYSSNGSTQSTPTQFRSSI
jgi:hypothetical protein